MNHVHRLALKDRIILKISHDDVKHREQNHVLDRHFKPWTHFRYAFIIHSSVSISFPSRANVRPERDAPHLV